MSDKNDLPPQVQVYAQAAQLADSTRGAYWGDLQRFIEWGGIIPATARIVASYLVAHATSHKYATLARWKVSIGKAHTTQGLDDPTKMELVHAVLKGIKQKHGQGQRQVAPLTKEKIVGMVSHMGDSIRDKRDKALILVGFAGGLRRSDLVDLTFEDLTEREGGFEFRLRKNKIAIPTANGSVCAVKALREWLKVSEIESGPIFQRISRHGKRSGKPLTGHGVVLIVKERVQSIGLDPADYSGFSLRAGLISSAADQGISLRQATSLNGTGVL